jgi:hypothetical protein
MRQQELVHGRQASVSKLRHVREVTTAETRSHLSPAIIAPPLRLHPLQIRLALDAQCMQDGSRFAEAGTEAIQERDERLASLQDRQDDVLNVGCWSDGWRRVRGDQRAGGRAGRRRASSMCCRFGASPAQAARVQPRLESLLPRLFLVRVVDHGGLLGSRGHPGLRSGLASHPHGKHAMPHFAIFVAQQSLAERSLLTASLSANKHAWQMAIITSRSQHC